MDEQNAFLPDAVHLSLDGFEGPLDLLLELARRQKVDLARISITTLVDQYLLAVSDAERFDLMRAADWLVMAAWLTWLKSRLLLPVEPEEARGAEQAQQVLTQRLIELERVRAAADWLDGQPQLGWDVFERGGSEPTQAPVPVANTVMLMDACLGVLRLSETRPEQVYQPRQIVEWTPHQAMMRIQSMLDSNPRGGDMLGFVPAMREGLPNRETSLRVAISGTLIASLEMAREARVHLHQDMLFGRILVEAPRKGSDRPKLDHLQETST